MQQCPQTETQSVYQHGVSVKEHMFELIDMLRNNKLLENWKLPEWLFAYREQILSQLLPDAIIEEYTLYHDCGKPYCLTYDQDGKRHFPDHAAMSYHTWLSAGGNKTAAKLMNMDMIIHTIKNNELDQFILNPEAITLLLAGLAEIHSNSKMF